MDSFNEKIAVITGAGSGLGRGMALHAAGEGMRSTCSSIGVSCLVPGAVATNITHSTRNRPDEPPAESQAPDRYFVADALGQMLGDGGDAILAYLLPPGAQY